MSGHHRSAVTTRSGRKSGQEREESAKKSESPASDQPDIYSEEYMQEQELRKKHRELRILEKDFRAYKEDTQYTIKKCQKEIDSLEKEKAEVLLIIKNIDENKVTRRDDTNCEELGELSRTEHDYRRQLQEEKDRQKEVDAEIAEMNKKIKEQRRAMGGTQGPQEKQRSNNKKKTVFENRLDKENAKFAQQLKQNGEMREAIDHLRKEREKFDHLHKRLADELDILKEELREWTEHTTEVFKQRDDAQNKMVNLVERNTKEAEQHKIDINELHRQICHDENLRDFLTIKSDERTEYIEEEEDKKRRMAHYEEKARRRQAILDTYEDAYKHIREVTGLEDLDDMVEIFINSEKKNFSLYKLVNELTYQVETLKDEVELAKERQEDLQKESDKKEEERHTKLKELEAKQKTNMESANKHEERTVQIAKTMDQVNSMMDGLYGKIGCDPEALQDTLGTEKVTNGNVMLYMALVEQRVNTLLHANYRIQKKQAEEDSDGEMPGTELAYPDPLRAETPFLVRPPSAGDDDDVDYTLSDGELSARPLTKEELRQQVAMELSEAAAKNKNARVTPKRGKSNKKVSPRP